MLNRLADRYQQLEPLTQGQLAVVAELSNWHAVDQFHHKVGASAGCRPGVEDSGNVLMIHHCQRLPLGLEPSDDLAAVHSRLDDLERDLAAHRLLLLRHVDGAHASLTNLFEQLVGADDRTGRLERFGRVPGRAWGRHRLLEEVAGIVPGGQQGVDSRTKCLIAGTGAFQERLALRAGRAVERLAEDGFELGADIRHRRFLVHCRFSMHHLRSHQTSTDVYLLLGCLGFASSSSASRRKP